MDEISESGRTGVALSQLNDYIFDYYFLGNGKNVSLIVIKNVSRYNRLCHHPTHATHDSKNLPILK